MIFLIIFIIKNGSSGRRNILGFSVSSGMFGRGKTLSMTKYAVDIYNKYQKYGKTVRIVSNYEIKSVPYIPLVNFEQIVELGNLAVEGKDDCIGTIVCIDEIEMLFSHRKFASFPIEVLSSVCQSRKAHIMMLTSAQRWKMQDAAIRDITYYAINCKKIWRFQLNYWFDASILKLLWPCSKVTPNTSFISCAAGT